ncbi:MAG: hypothetical protein L3J32_04420 [Rhizobiaceae bacterium]|nr:hypothetical protein [Rhizobiaceae bacterium]
MKRSLIIATATLMVISVASPQFSTAFAQETTPQKQTEGMMKDDKMPGQKGMMKDGAKPSHAGKKGMMKQNSAKHGMQGMSGMMGMMKQMQKMRKNMMSMNFVVREKPYSNDDIKRLIDGRLAKNGFSRLMAGDVADGKKEGAALVDVVSAKGEFLFKVRVNRKTGKAVIID